MANTKEIVTVTIALVIAGALFLPLVDTVNSQTGTQTVTNETVTADYNSSVDLDGYNVVENSETVYGFNDTSGSYEEASSPDDYTLNYEPGTIDFNSSSTLVNESEDVKVTYDYEATSGTTTTVAALIPLIVLVMVLGLVADKVRKEVR